MSANQMAPPTVGDRWSAGPFRPTTCERVICDGSGSRRHRFRPCGRLAVHFAWFSHEGSSVVDTNADNGIGICGLTPREPCSRIWYSCFVGPVSTNGPQHNVCAADDITLEDCPHRERKARRRSSGIGATFFRCKIDTTHCRWDELPTHIAAQRCPRLQTGRSKWKIGAERNHLVIVFR